MLSDAIKGRIGRPGSEANTGLMSLAHNALGFPSVNKVLGHVGSHLCYTATGFICHFRSSTCMFHLPIDQYETQYKPCPYPRWSGLFLLLPLPLEINPQWSVSTLLCFPPIIYPSHPLSSFIYGMICDDSSYCHKETLKQVPGSLQVALPDAVHWPLRTGPT